MSATGVVLFHGTKTRLNKGPARAWLTKLKADLPSFETDDGDGLCMILCGDKPNPRLLHLASLTAKTSSYFQFRQVFRRLGAATKFEWKSKAEQNRAIQSATLADAATSALTKATATIAERDASLQKLNDAYDTRHKKVTLVQAENYDLRVDLLTHSHRGDVAARQIKNMTVQLEIYEIELTRGQAKQDATAQALAKTRSKFSKIQTALTISGQKQQNLTGTIDQLQDELRDRFEELGALTKDLENKQKHTVTQEVCLADTVLEISALTDHTHDLKVENAALTADHADTVKTMSQTTKSREDALRDMKTRLTNAEAAMVTATEHATYQTAEVTRLQALTAQQSEIITVFGGKLEQEKS